jgi:hypothetical protein
MRFSFVIPVIFCILALLLTGCTGQNGGSLPVSPAATSPVETVITTPITSVTQSSPVPGAPLTTPALGGLTIEATPEKYSPIMSSTVGIRLTPHYDTPAAVVYNWTTNYGYFLSWNAPDWKVNQHGENIDTTNETIYWTYSPEDMGKEKPPVTIRLIIKTPPRNHGGNGTIAWKDIHITWENTDTAVIAQAACGIQNCHGMEISCGPNVVEMCTMQYMLGDKCRSLASCQNINGSCTVVKQEGYSKCVSCVEECIRTAGSDPVKAFECESRC